MTFDERKAREIKLAEKANILAQVLQNYAKQLRGELDDLTGFGMMRITKSMINRFLTEIDKLDREWRGIDENESA